MHPHDPEARIRRMKDGRTRLAHKLEAGVDMETGAVAGVTVQTMDGGDTGSLAATAAAAALADAPARHFATIVGQIGRIFGLHGPHTGFLRPPGRLSYNKPALTRLPPLLQSTRWRTTSSTAC